MEKEKEGFPITSLREINMLLKGKHPNVVFVKVRVSPLTPKEVFNQFNRFFIVTGVSGRE